MTSTETKALLGALQTLGIVSRAGLKEGEALFSTLEVKRHQLLQLAGEPVERSGLVVSGVIREFYLLDDGTERTRGFALAGDPFGSASDSISHRPSRAFLRAETDATVFTASWAELEALTEQSLEWERMRHAIIERLYLRKAEREYQLLALDAMQRYQAMRAQQPKLESLVPQLLIASYLGITAVHLSRLRRRLGETKKSAARR